jgi:hypothetical protein
MSNARLLVVVDDEFDPCEADQSRY